MTDLVVDSIFISTRALENVVSFLMVPAMSVFCFDHHPISLKFNGISLQTLVSIISDDVFKVWPPRKSNIILILVTRETIYNSKEKRECGTLSDFCFITLFLPSVCFV